MTMPSSWVTASIIQGKMGTWVWRIIGSGPINSLVSGKLHVQPPIATLMNIEWGQGEQFLALEAHGQPIATMGRPRTPGRMRGGC